MTHMGDSVEGSGNARAEGIAIVGVSLRLPGAESMDEFWQLLDEGRCVIGDPPPERRESAGRAARGGFLADADAFDAAFFNISPREAMFMDPQQRFAMELAWQAIEDAGYRAAALQGSRTGVFMGVANSDYTELAETRHGEVDAYLPTGTSAAIIANRVSYWFDLHGPSMTIDTACASSLVAVQQAVRALEHGDCEYALAGGVNLCWSSRRFEALSRNGMLSDDGLCRAFDSRADGYVRAEGGAVVLLKPLATAVADGDAIHAVVRGIGSNHGGRTNSLTITNPQAHADLVSDVYTRAGVGPDTVGYIEAHGPGTPLGDPIEVHGLKSAFGRLAERAGVELRPGACGLGSVKTNIGHLESAAGLAGMLKVVAAIRHRTLPATLHFDKPNPLIKLDGSPFRVVDRAQPWEPVKGADGEALPRRAGVSSFGFGGSNAHVLLEEYLPAQSARDDDAGAAPQARQLIPMSATTGEQLRSMARNLLRAIEVAATDPGSLDAPGLRDIAYTLQTGRTEWPHRVAFVVTDFDELAAELRSFTRDEGSARCWQGTVENQPRLTVLENDEDAAAMLRSWGAKDKLDKVAELWTLGGPIEWDALRVGGPARRTHLPTYPFQRRRYWLPTAPDEAATADRADVPVHRADTEAEPAPAAPAGIQLAAPAAYASPRIQPQPGVPKPSGIGLRELPEPSASTASPVSPGHPAQRAPQEADRALLERRLASSLAEVLYLEPHEVSIDGKFIDIGLDSIVAVEWIRVVNTCFGASLETADVYEFPTIRELAAELARATRPAAPAGGAATATEPGAARVTEDIPRSVSVDPSSLVGELIQTLAEVLYVPTEELGAEDKFIDVGLDSIIAVEWMGVVNARYGTDLPVADIYEYPTLREFAVHLAGRMTSSADDSGIEEVLRQVVAGSLEVEEAERMLESQTHVA
ncbi:beta-ketoacyl synthase N-terminal-like domain-containing protein [Streptomyces albus]|uniref:beta-ketoacyl synthase N-terminal-like domain-containing protein n=1 Tax=Streptomyces albus TaxID=1888 RepID=UPI00099C0550|nr:beta-ketoacyl synthase N-terminal-like domain-containing protein [Streptomyces albus]